MTALLVLVTKAPVLATKFTALTALVASRRVIASALVNGAIAAIPAAIAALATPSAASACVRLVIAQCKMTENRLSHLRTGSRGCLGTRQMARVGERVATAATWLMGTVMHYGPKAFIANVGNPQFDYYDATCFTCGSLTCD
jgi:hypothetical protein